MIAWVLGCIVAILVPLQAAADGANAVPAADAEVFDAGAFFEGFSGAFVIRDEAGCCTYEFNPPQCARRFPPCSTFKIPNSVIGLETGVISGPDQFFKWDGQKRNFESWNHDMMLPEAMKVSCVPCFQQVAAQIGRERMTEYIERFAYGNKDISGDITTFWLGSPLEITAREQSVFLDRLFSGEFGVSERTLDIVRQITLIEQSERGILRGKTGSDVTDAGEEVLGWFVGFVEATDNRYFFACNIIKGDKPAGFKAREIAKNILTAAGLLGSVGTSPKIQMKSDAPADGFYILQEEKEYVKRFERDPATSRILVYDQSEISGIPDIPVRYFIAGKTPDVPLKLKGDPERITDDQGKTMLNLRIDDEYIPVLERVTRENMMRKQFAVVIGGRMISAHKIRAPITDGKLQISRCSDNVCERIYADLTQP